MILQKPYLGKYICTLIGKYLTPSSYVASLESKLEKLEKRLAALQDACAPSAPPTPDHRHRNKQQKVDDDGEVEDLVADLGYM